MLPTFVIGLREGLEAALIVGIVAAFLRQRGRSDLLRWVFVGVFSAIALCTAAGVTLDVVSRNLPQRQQEGLETVIGLVAVAMVTYMVVWMKRHSRELKGQLDQRAGAALAAGSGIALIAMAFLAVLREGLETVVFLLAAFNESGTGNSAAAGAVLGILTAVALGYAIYRGGVRLNLSKFFRATGVILVLVAAGLLVNALHTAHEAGWLDAGQQSTFDLSALVAPGTVRASLLTGMLGLQSQPVLIEVIGWLLYLIPVGLYVAWPPGRALSRGTVQRITLAGGCVSAVAALLLAVAAPAQPASNPTTTDGAVTARLVGEPTQRAIVVTQRQTPAEARTVREQVTLDTTRTGAGVSHGVPVSVYRATMASVIPGPATMSFTRLAALGGGRLPLGVISANGQPADGTSTAAVTRRSVEQATVWIAPDTGRVVDIRWSQRVSLVAHFSIGDTVIGDPRTGITSLSDRAAASAAAAARHDASTIDDRRLLQGLAWLLGIIAAALLSCAGWLILLGRRDRRTEVVPVSRTPVSTRR